MIKCLPVLLSLVASVLCPCPLSASPQMPDYLIFRGDTVATYHLILEGYLQSQEQTPSDKLFGLSFRNSSSQGGFSFNCWRGYQAIYQIDHDSLFLVAIIGCGERRGRQIDVAASSKKMRDLFNNNVRNDRVYINWFSGDLSFPLTNKVLRWDGVFFTSFEKEEVVNIVKGRVLTVNAVENYLDDPERINRRYQSHVSDLLFKRLKKVKWKNKEEYDCSGKYFVTIDEHGDVSKVRMLESPPSIDDIDGTNEYKFCVDKIFNAVKQLKFDIIKNKGKPISEDIYIQIWIEDNGKIKNWTR